MPSYHSKFLDTATLLQKASWQLYSALSAATLTLLTPPTGNFRLKITLSASTTHTNCGSVAHPAYIYINASQVTFTQAGTQTTSTTLSAIPVITTSGLDCWILIEAIDTSGQPIYKETSTSIACFYDESVKGYYGANGVWTVSNSRMETDEAPTAVVGDTVTFDGRTFPIKFVTIRKNRLRLELFRVLQF